MATIASPVLHYAIQGRLGAGGMGVVYRAIDTKLDRPVALKFLPETQSVDSNAKRRLTLEARAAAKLDHPNIGVVHDIEEFEGQLFIVMALYQGESLKERLQRSPLSLSEALDYGLQAANGLAAAHDIGIVHRDIKPANLFLTGDGLVKILDFGLVKFEESRLDQGEGLTMPGAILGTPEYMPPEQVRGLQVDRRADLWALGAVLYEMVTAVSPFRAEGGLPATLLQIMNGTPRRASELVAGAPPELDRIFERALAKDRDERFGSAQEMASQLSDLIGGSASEVSGSPPLERTTSRSDRTRLDGRSAPPEGDSQTGTGRYSVADLTLERPGTPAANALLEPVPHLQRFIGREEALADLLDRLRRDRLVAIRGIAGAGKSAVGAQLATSLVPEEKVFWFTFDPVEKNSVDSLFWSLAAFLRNRGETLLWRYLQGEIEAHKPLDMTVRINLFLSSLSAGEYVFCLDDLHLVAAVPEVAELLKTLQKHVLRDGAALHASFILMGRELPSDIDFRAESLTGFTPEEASELLESRDVKGLPEPLARRLCERTGGNPTILDLCASALARLSQDVGARSSFVDSMTGRGDIRDYVMGHIYADLPASEKSVLDALSIFPGSVELDVAEETLSAGGLQGIVPCVDSLIGKAIVHETGQGQIYCHELVREFCYRSLDRPAKRRLHEHAARYYEERKNILRAAHHYLELGESEQALNLLIENIQPIIHAGGSATLIDQLSRFDLASLSDEQQMAARRAKGEASFVRGEYRRAVNIYQEALDDAFEPSDEADLQCRIASAFDKLGEHERAIEFAQLSLKGFESVASKGGVAQVLRVLAWAHYRLGRLEEAEQEFTAGHELAEQVGDRVLVAQMQQGLGIMDLRAGRLEEARQRLEASRRTFRELRDRIAEAEATGNLAWVYGRLGNVERELSLDQKVMEILEHIGDVGNLLIAYNNTGDLYFRSGGYRDSLQEYRKLADLAQRIEHPGWLIAARVGLAENHLALGEIEEALEQGRSALELARGAGDSADVDIERAMSLRVLGEIHLALGQPGEARRRFEESISTLEEAREEEELGKVRRGLESALERIEKEVSAPEREVV